MTKRTSKKSQNWLGIIGISVIAILIVVVLIYINNQHSEQVRIQALKKHISVILQAEDHLSQEACG